MPRATAPATGVDVAIVGFGFSGLATLAHLTRSRPGLRIAVLAEDDRGLGLAYRTRDPGHLLNVIAGRMGLWADDPGDFGRWLAGPEARAAAARLSVPVPSAESFAPRALYAAYLCSVRDAVLAGAGESVHFLPGRARSLVRAGDRWEIGGDVRLSAAACVLATGHDLNHVFGTLRHERLHDGPWELPQVDRWDGPVVLIGSGLTAVDAVMSLRRGGYRGPVVALSRHGRLPAAHTVTAPEFELTDARADELRTVSEMVAFIRRGGPQGAWRPALDALRPHTVRLWERLSHGEQRAAARRFSGLWSVLRHRMAPVIAAAITDELAGGGLVVEAVDRLEADVQDDELTVTYRPRGAPGARVLRPTAVIDCTGPQLRCADSGQPLLRELVSGGAAQAHATGLGLAADEDHRVGPDLYALGPLLIGQRWESVAVPELRDSAAVIAAAVAAAAAVGRRPAQRRAERGETAAETAGWLTTGS